MTILLHGWIYIFFLISQTVFEKYDKDSTFATVFDDERTTPRGKLHVENGENLTVKTTRNMNITFESETASKCAVRSYV